MKQIVLWIVAGMLCSCGGKSSSARSQFGETCMIAEDCVSGLTCVTGGTSGVGLCTMMCSDTTGCQTLKKGTVCSSNYCYVPCVDGSMCSGLKCVMDAFTMQGTGVCKTQ